jgi:hypothetical protein
VLFIDLILFWISLLQCLTFLSLYIDLQCKHLTHFVSCKIEFSSFIEYMKYESEEHSRLSIENLSKRDIISYH